MDIYKKKFTDFKMFIFLKNQFSQILSNPKIFIKKLIILNKLMLANILAFLFLPVTIFIKLISKSIIIKFSEIPSNRIGHLTMELELYLVKKMLSNKNLKKKVIHIFSIQFFDSFVCNKKLFKYIKKKIIILPSFLVYPFIINSRYYKIFSDQYFSLSSNAGRDIENLLDKTPPSIILEKNDIKIGEEFLYKISNLGPKIKIILLMVRDSSYLSKIDKNKDWSYHNYRDGNIDDYIPACEELTKYGYYIFRMGQFVKKKISTNNPMIIDYATNGMRTELLDIYLSSKCEFCISSSTGLDGLAQIFRKSILFTNFTPVGGFSTFSRKFLFTIRHHYSKKLNRRLSLKEIFNEDVFYSLKKTDFLDKDILLQDNSPEEIKEAAIEMKDFVNNFNQSTCNLNKIFWEIYQSLIYKFNIQERHGLILSKISSKFLQKNKYFIEGPLLKK